MKRKIALFFICVFAFVGAFFGINFSVDANASITSPEITESTRANYNMDESLFKALLAITKQLSYNKNVYGFDADLLTYGYKNYTPNQNWDMTVEPYKTFQENRDAIVNDLNKGELDLTVGKNAKYVCLQNTKLQKIQDISGLNNIDLETIKTLTINDAKIDKVSNEDFETLTSLTSLSMKNCGLNSFELNPSITKLNSLNLSGNNLTKLDASNMYVSFGVNPVLDVSNNKFSNLDDLVLATTSYSKLNLNFNLLSEFSDIDYQNLSSKVLNSNNLFVGIQSKNSLDNLVAGDKILVSNYQNNFVNELNVVASYYAGTTNSLKSDFYVSGQDNTICQTTGTQNLEYIYAPAGKVYLEFFAGNNLVDVAAYPEFTSKYVRVPLSAPAYVLKVDGQIVVDTYQQNDISVLFDVVQNQNIPNLDDVLSANGAKIYSGTNIKLSTEPQNKLVVSNNGTFSLSAKVEFDGILSDAVNFDITRQNTQGIVWGVIIIVFMIIIGAAIYNIVKWAQNGAVVAPLSDKEIYRVKRRQERRYGRERESNKKPLDASLRQAWREKNRPQEDVLGSEINERSGSFYNANEQSDYNEENYDDDYRKLTHSSYEDGYLDENLNEEQNDELNDEDVERDQEENGDDDYLI